MQDRPKMATAPRRWGMAGLASALVLTGGAALTVHAAAQSTPSGAAACPGDNGGLSLSPGFCATVFADNLGHVRHMAVAANGVLYANTWSGTYFPGQPPPPGGFLVALKDSRGDGHADQVTRFGQTPQDGVKGGSGVALYRGWVYAEVNDRIVRYRIPEDGGAPSGEPQVVLSGLPLTGDHPMHPFVIDPKGRIFVDLGTATNSCQPKNRMPRVPGAEPCIERETRGGIWLYDANALDQKFSAAERFVSGLRNGEGMAFDSAGRMFATQHGRDQLLQNWPTLYPDAKAAAEQPAEELVQVKAGADYGWPYCYFDGVQNKLVLAPEYGGDGGKAVGVCAQKQGPVAFFPAHWAPNDLAIYNRSAFPAPYRGGAFIAFHGSWNRAPAPQGGYNVVFQPLKDGKASGAFVIFADGFAGRSKDPGRAAFRPTGLAVAPDGALFISDDVHGRLWRVTYHGAPNIAAVAAAPAPVFAAANVAAAPPPKAGLPIQPGATAEQVVAGDKLFHDTTCTGCHGGDAKGTPLGPDLTAGTWLWGDGSVAALSKTISQGVAEPKRYRSGMPPMGGAPLSKPDLDAVAAYVWAVGHQKP